MSEKLPDWTEFQPIFRDHLHAMRGHTFPPSEECASCDQDADQMARAAVYALKAHGGRD